MTWNLTWNLEIKEVDESILNLDIIDLRLDLPVCDVPTSNLMAHRKIT